MPESNFSLVDPYDESTFDVVYCIDGPLSRQRKLVSKGATEGTWPDLPVGKYVKSTELVANEYAWLYVSPSDNAAAVLARYKNKKPDWAGVVNPKPQHKTWGWVFDD